MGELSVIRTTEQLAQDMRGWLEVTPQDFDALLAGGFRVMEHHGERVLRVTVSTDRYDVFDAHAEHFGIRTWAHVTVSVAGSLQVRLEDQVRIGRVRQGGERSPAPLPDWYELAHIAYGHAREVGMDPTRATWQYLPPPSEDRLNIAEALHLRQPK